MHLLLSKGRPRRPWITHFLSSVVRTQGNQCAGASLAGSLLLSILVLFSSTVTADTETELEEYHVEADHGHGHGYHTHTFGVFIGRAQDGRENAPAVALEYEYRFNKRFGLGGFAEYTGDEADFWIAAVPFGFHFGNLKTYIAPGLEKGHHGTHELLRLGAEYAFALSDDGWEIAPQINIDFVDGEEVWVFGVLIAKGF